MFNVFKNFVVNLFQKEPTEIQPAVVIPPLSEIQLLRERAISLKEAADIALPLSLRDSLFIGYQKQVTNKLTNLLRDTDVLSPNKIEELEEFFRENWEMVKGSMLGYTATPKSEVTLLLVALAEYVANIQEKPAIHILMPGVATESTSDHYPELHELPLIEVLSTHILGKNGKYLIPIKSILEYAEPMALIGAKNAPNFYYDFTVHSPEDAFLTEEEWSRVLSHSDKTALLQNMALDYERIQKEDRSLLKHLEVLLQKLYLNSVDGGGEEYRAGEDVYSALIDFKIFYDSLSADEHAKVPDELQDELQSFFNLISNKDDYGAGVESVKTCIAIRRDRLQILVSEHRAILFGIGITDSDHQNLLQEAFETFKDFQKQIEEDFNEGNYKTGYDKSGLTLPLLKGLETDLDIFTEAHVSLFFDSSIADIQAILADDETLKDGIANVILNAGDINRQILLRFLPKFSDEKAKILIEIIHKPLIDLIDSRRQMNSFLYSNLLESFSTLLAQFQGEKFSSLCNIARDIMENRYDFKDLIHHLDVVQSQEFCEFFRLEFQGIVPNWNELQLLLSILDDDKFKIVVDILIKNDLKRFFDDAFDLINFLNVLTEQQSINFFNGIGNHIQDILTENMRQELVSCCRYNDSVYFKEKNLIWKFILEPNLSLDEQARICDDLEFLSHEERGRIKFDDFVAQLDAKSLTIKSQERKRAINNLVAGLKSARKNFFEDKTTTKEEFVEACNYFITSHGPLLAKSHYKDGIGNLLLAISSVLSMILVISIPIVVGVLAYNHYKRGHCFTFFDTGSKKLLNQAEPIMDELNTENLVF